jgi:hypothetical protein
MYITYSMELNNYYNTMRTTKLVQKEKNQVLHFNRLLQS